jgi:hypothetical protein
MDALFYEYGVKPLEKEFSNYEKKVSELMQSKGLTYAEGFLAWQIFKLRKLEERLNEKELKEMIPPTKEE